MRMTEELETHCWLENVKRETLSGGDMITTELRFKFYWHGEICVVIVAFLILYKIKIKKKKTNKLKYNAKIWY